MSDDILPDGDPPSDEDIQGFGIKNRKDDDRRAAPGMPPDGIERRQWHDRRKARAQEGRERYLDMVQKERVMLLDQGVVRSTDQLLDMAGGGGGHTDLEDEAVRDRATGDMLRSILPVQSWLPLSIHLIDLREGVLRVAPLFRKTMHLV